MKKTISMLLLIALVFSLAACNADNGTKESPSTNPSQNPSASQNPSETPSTDTPESETPPSASPHYPLTISTHNFAKEKVDVTFEKAPERVLTFWTNSMETMLALGLGDRIICAVGVKRENILPELQADFDQFAAGTEYNEFVNSNASMSKEYAIMLQPDFILAWKSSFSDSTIGDVGYWHENDIGTYIALNSNDISEYRTIENEYTDILNIGKIFDVEDKAQSLVDEMKNEVERVTKATAKEEKRTVLVIEFLGGRIVCYNKTYLAGNMVQAMGGNLLDTPNELGVEDVLNQNPDVIFIISSKDETVTDFLENPAYASLTAIHNNDVFRLPLSDVYTSGVRTINGLNRIGRALYPELYS